MMCLSIENNRCMKKYITALLIMCLSLSASAQKHVKMRNINDMVFISGSQLWSLTGSFIDNKIYLKDNIHSIIPAIRLRGEIGVYELPFGGNVGAGWSFGYGKVRENRTLKDVQIGWDEKNKKPIKGTEYRQYEWTQIPIGPTLSFHYALFDHCDVYVKGFFCIDFGGFTNMKQELDFKRPKQIKYDYGFVAGADYFITDRIGVCVEAGLQSQWLSAGIVFSFGGGAQSDLFHRTPRDI